MGSSYARMGKRKRATPSGLPLGYLRHGRMGVEETRRDGCGLLQRVEREQGGCGARGQGRSQQKKAKASNLSVTPFIEVSGRNVLGLARADSVLEGAKGSSTRRVTTWPR
jgi:hypothetical protein